MLSKVSWIGLAFLGLVSGFQIPSPPSSASSTVAVIPSINAPAGARRHSDYSIMELRSTSSKKGYEPKWKKKKTLADEMGKPKDLSEVGIKGTVSVVFRQGNETKTTMAMPGHLLRDVASQAGQFIKYGCGKGECGTCECLVNGQWIRPCSTMVPGDIPAGQDYVVQVKDVKNKAKSSGKFFSVRSFLAGFWNNLLGMVGFVKYRRAAKKNWNERQEYEDLIKQKTLEKKLARQKMDLDATNGESGGKFY